MLLKPYKILSVLVVVISFALLWGYGSYVEPSIIKIKEIDLSHKAVPEALEGIKIVHISDVHISRFGEFETRILNTIDEIKPDLIFLTGDYIQWKGSNQGAMEFLSRLNARRGVFGVMGDHDYSVSKNSCLFCHEKGSGRPTKSHSVIMLRNAEHKITINGQQIRIIGLDGESDDYNSFLKLEDESNNQSYSLILSHSPLSFDSYSGKDRIVMFSGDTHGGQVRLPKWLFRLFGYEKNVNYNYGLFQEGEKIMFVTRGLGTSHFRFRFFCPPEIAVIRF